MELPGATLRKQKSNKKQVYRGPQTRVMKQSFQDLFPNKTIIKNATSRLAPEEAIKQKTTSLKINTNASHETELPGSIKA